MTIEIFNYEIVPRFSKAVQLHSGTVVATTRRREPARIVLFAALSRVAATVVEYNNLNPVKPGVILYSADLTGKRGILWLTQLQKK